MRRTRVLAALALIAVTVAVQACGKKGPPSGGPPDLEPPRLIAVEPDSGTARVALDVQPTLSFSEPMEPRSTGAAIALAPRIDIRRVRWHGRAVTLDLAEPLSAGRTYWLFVGGGARDRHGNAIASGRTVVFTTADTLPPGVVEGEIQARGMSASGTYLWCYEASRRDVPDSTARDFDALGVADTDGKFRVVGLTIPGSYRLWAFSDLNGNRSFEPAVDVLAEVDTVFALRLEDPVARGVRIALVNPRAPGRVRGTVLDTLGTTVGKLRVLAVSVSDTMQRVLVDVTPQFEFDVALEIGKWTLRAFRDADQNRTWDRAVEPASHPATEVVVEPASDIRDVTLVLRWLRPEER